MAAGFLWKVLFISNQPFAISTIPKSVLGSSESFGPEERVEKTYHRIWWLKRAFTEFFCNLLNVSISVLTNIFTTHNTCYTCYQIMELSLQRYMFTCWERDVNNSECMRSPSIVVNILNSTEERSRQRRGLKDFERFALHDQHLEWRQGFCEKYYSSLTNHLLYPPSQRVFLGPVKALDLRRG